ncbi:MAG: hypothetical protein WB797_14075 [Nocardioides sp.]
MASWRDAASAQVQADLDSLLDAALTTAEQSLRDSGGFLPFAVARSYDGEDQLVNVAVTSDRPEAEELLASLWRSLTEHSGDFRAAGLVTDRTGADGDRVAVQLEHADGPAIEVTLPYRLVDGAFEPGELTAGEGIARIW